MSIKYTNKHNLDKPLVDWLTKDEYDHEGDTVSATTLLKSPRQVILKERHSHEIELDVSDLVASRFGTAIHNSFELSFEENKDYKQEERHYRELDGYKISGKFDFILGNQLHDIKTTSVWTYMFDSNREKYIQQQSIYRWLMEGKQEINDICKIVYVFTDWSKLKTLQDAQYPKTRVLTKEYKLMSLEETRKFIESRLRGITLAKDMSDTELPYCTKDELWQDKDTFAVKKDSKAKRALKVFDSLEEALKYQREKNAKTLEHRKGGAQACNYCDVRRFCNQYKLLEEQGLIK